MILLKVFFVMMMVGIIGMIAGALLWEDVLGRQADERFMNGTRALFFIGTTGLLLMIMFAAIFSKI